MFPHMFLFMFLPINLKNFIGYVSAQNSAYVAANFSAYISGHVSANVLPLFLRM